MVQETYVASSGWPPLLTNVALVLLLLLLQAQFGQILVQVTREATMTAVGYFNAVQAAGQAAGPTASSTVVMPVKQVGWAGKVVVVPIVRLSCVAGISCVLELGSMLCQRWLGCVFGWYAGVYDCAGWWACMHATAGVYEITDRSHCCALPRSTQGLL
jgi:hypothetical protein